MRRSFVSGVLFLVSVSLVAACAEGDPVSAPEAPNRSGLISSGNRGDTVEASPQSGLISSGNRGELPDSTGN